MIDCLVNSVSSIFGCPKPHLSKANYCHGSTFSTLYLICKQSGEEQNSLIPFGKLAQRKIPVFAGECASESACLGIGDESVNATNTSWTWIYNYSKSLNAYAKKYPFNPKNAEDFFLDIVKDFKNNPTFPPYRYDKESRTFNNLFLQLRQLRAWNEKEFQDKLATDLKAWIEALISFREKCEEKTTEEDKSALEKIRAFAQELSDKPTYSLTEVDKENIQKNFPILFITNLKDADSYWRGCEVGYSRNMKLGREVKWIATDPQYMEELQNFLKLKNLTRKVSVVSTDLLKKRYD